MDITNGKRIQAAEDNSQHHDVLLELGACHLSIGNYKKAQHYYEKSASLGADEPELYLGLGSIALNKGLLEEAEVAFSVATRLDRNCADAFCGLANVYQEKGDIEKAHQAYIKCLNLDNEHLKAILGLFQTSRQQGVFSEIICRLERYLKLHPDDEKVMFCLAIIDMVDGQLNRATEALSKLLALILIKLVRLFERSAAERFSRVSEGLQSLSHEFMEQ